MKFYYENRSHLLYDAIQISIYQNENFNYVAHWHNDFELAYVEKGCITVGVNNDQYRLDEGDMVVLNSGDIHYYESTDTPSKIIILVFNLEYIGLSSNWPPNGEFLSPIIKKNIAENSSLSLIRDILFRIVTENNLKEKYYEFFIKARLNEICGLLLRNLDTKVRGSKSNTKLQTMQNVIMFIEDNFLIDISLTEIAKHLNIDPYNLSKNFNALTGTNLKTYINTLRIFKAESTILNTEKSLTEIALESGFNSTRSFNRAFMCIKGYTPSSLRQH